MTPKFLPVSTAKRWFLWTAAGVLLCGVLSGGQAAAEPQKPTSAPPALVELGRATYERQCATCHGAEGKGDGPAAYLLYPKPRDLTTARYRLTSTWERVPTDQDLFETFTRGIPGSAMPPWGHLPEKTRRALVAYIKSLAEKPIEVAPPKDPSPSGLPGTGVIRVPDEPPYGPAERKQAAYLFKEACAACHGPEGRGDGVQRQVDSDGYPTHPRDLTLGIYKGTPEPESVYRRITAGMQGTPMPSSDWAYGTDAWHLVHYVLELSTPEQREAARMTADTIRAVRVKRLPDGPGDSTWEGVATTRVTLMPLWWRNDRIASVSVRAAHDGKRLAVRLHWDDTTADDAVLGQQAFTDGAALQFSEETDPPLFAMGTSGSPVSIWYWRAAWERDMTAAPGMHDLYAAMLQDGYLGQPDLATFETGQTTGNPVSGTKHPSSVEDLRAKGFGTLTSQRGKRSVVRGHGTWEDGAWTVVFVRDLKPLDAGDVRLDRGVQLSMAVWDGAADDRNGQKSVSVWHNLLIEP